MRIIERLVIVVSVLFALTFTFLIYILFSKEIVDVSNFLFRFEWDQLSEGYQLLFLGIPFTIISTVIGHVINKKYIDPLFSIK